MEPGETKTIYGNPVKEEHPIGQAKLVKKKDNFNKVEIWSVVFTGESFEREVLIKK
jgi:hypothetical protein